MKTTSASTAARSDPDRAPEQVAADRTGGGVPSAWRVEVARRPERSDPQGTKTLEALGELAPGAVTQVRFVRGTLLSASYTRAAVEDIARTVLADPVVDTFTVFAPGEAAPARDGWHRIAVAAQPGVMDAVGRTVERLLTRTGRVPEHGPVEAKSYRVYELEGRLSPAQLTDLGRRALANETIEVLCIDRDDLPFGRPEGHGHRGRVEVPLRELDPEGLERLSVEGTLSLTREEMLAVQAHYRGLDREPSMAELETIAQTWSEHCKHKTLTGVVELERADGSVERIDNLLKTTIAAATRELGREDCLSVFVDNAGIVRFEGETAVCIKVETHNHPSAIDPYGGAGTGIGGVIRDVLGAGLGAKPIANLDAFFVGPPDLEDAAVPTGTMHPRRILRGVVEGVRDYGNRMGIPTVAGGLWFHEGYVANPLVYAGTVGVMPARMAHKEVRPGDRIVSLGGRTGRDGIHGATFSSISLSEHSETESSHAVQIGDPITEKVVLDVLLAARDRGLYRAVTDCGAGGYSSAVGEMGEHCGARVHLERVPLKYPGLSSHEIWISEAQERMVLAVPPEHLDELLALCAAEDAEAVEIGEFTDTGRLELYDGEACCADIAMAFLHDGTPRPVRRAREPRPEAFGPDPGCPAAEDPRALLLELAGAPDNTSREWIVRQYDHEVQGASVVKPLVGTRCDAPGNGAVLQPVPGSRRGLSLTCGANPRTGLLDPYAMALGAIDEALRNAVALGADPSLAAILDNFSWGNCDDPDQLGALVAAAEACRDAALAYGTPFVSGKDSLNNTYRVGERTLSIPPTLLISSIAPVPDVARALTMDAKRAGNAVYLVGATGPELGGSIHHVARGLAGGRVPRPDLRHAPALLRAVHAAARDGLLQSCHDLSEGGLGVAAAELCFAGELGLELDLAAAPLAELPGGYDADTTVLFAESCTRFLVEVAEQDAASFERVLAGRPFGRLGVLSSEPVLSVRRRTGEPWFDVPLAEVRAAHHGGFRS